MGRRRAPGICGAARNRAKGMTIKAMLEADRRKTFLLLREGRSVIQDAPLREHLLRLPQFEWMCPVQAVFYRRSGAR